MNNLLLGGSELDGVDSWSENRHERKKKYPPPITNNKEKSEIP